ncbi:hypothetical protein CCACVL1_02230 [Corchorus capsularis]|uniref:Uncharacterized protein n=1 Tax=Corchorus capsularis TaxID=210143 RepID=A0A1R3K9W2_COCAP|nr:hypothetical protein CCACVL1_02230 [Corchorus capsularis]
MYVWFTVECVGYFGLSWAITRLFAIEQRSSVPIQTGSRQGSSLNEKRDKGARDTSKRSLSPCSAELWLLSLLI